MRAPANDNRDRVAEWIDTGLAVACAGMVILAIGLIAGWL